MKDLLLDIRFAIRVLWKSPAFTVVALVTLTLGIAANVVVFGLVNAVLLRPLDVSDPDNLYQLRVGSWTRLRALTTSYPAFEDYQRRNTTFRAISGFYGYCSATLHSDNVTKSVSGYAVTGNYFEMLGVQPQVGRLIRPDDERGANSAPYVVLSDSLWRSAFNGDSRIIGKTVRLNKDPFMVLGVAPPEFHGTEKFEWPDYFIPIVNYFDSDYLRDRTGYPLTVLGRLKSGVTPQQAAEDLTSIAAQLAKEYPQTDTGLPLRLVHPGLHHDTGDVIRSSLYNVTALALLVLTAACANLATLFAARAADRNRELAVRVALGASRWRLMRQLLTEALIVALVGGAAGLLVAAVLLRTLDQGSLPSFLTFGHGTLKVEARVYVAALILTVVSGLVFGMIPALRIRQSNPAQAVKSGAVDSMPLGRFTSQDLLLGVQITICTLMVTSSIVAVRGMVRMLHTPLGFEPKGAMLAEIDLSEVEPQGEAPLEKKKAMIDVLRSIPGVSAVGTSSRAPFTGALRATPVFALGTTEFTINNAVLMSLGLTISPGYFEAARTRLLSGRDISWRDTVQTPYVAVVNETFGRKMWGDTPATGQRFIFLGRLREVVGVVEDGKYLEIQEASQPVVYLPLSQNEHADTVFAVRSYRSANEMAPAIERTLNTIEPNAPVIVQDWWNALAGSLSSVRAAAIALGALGVLAAMLTLTGILGMAAYNVSRRMKEIGIRVALGARARHVIHTAVSRPFVLLGMGSFMGLVWGTFANRLLGQIVDQANPRDPIVIIAVVLIMALLGLAASTIPLLRAFAVDPSKLLRTE
jgi:predicted permease